MDILLNTLNNLHKIDSIYPVLVVILIFIATGTVYTVKYILSLLKENKSLHLTKLKLKSEIEIIKLKKTLIKKRNVK